MTEIRPQEPLEKPIYEEISLQESLCAEPEIDQQPNGEMEPLSPAECVLVAQYADLVPRVAERFYKRYGDRLVNLEEARSYGNIALCRAIAKFKEGAGMPLDQYLTTRIWYGMVDGIRELLGTNTTKPGVFNPRDVSLDGFNPELGDWDGHLPVAKDIIDALTVPEVDSNIGEAIDTLSMQQLRQGVLKELSGANSFTQGEIEVITLTLRGLERKEIARIMDISTSLVGRKYRSAVEKLREVLAP